MAEYDESRERHSELGEQARSFDEPVTKVGIPATFRLLIESIKDYAIFMLDARGVVATWNEGARRIKGYAASEIIGKHFSNFYPREDVEAGKCEWELEVAEREGRFEDEGWRVRKDGSRFWANVIITALVDDSRNLVGFAKVTRDLTERVKAERERLEAAQERLKVQEERFEFEKLVEANRVKDQFLATISHELRTPLNAIVGWAELVLSGADPTVAEKGLQTILRNAQAQITIVDDMLDMSRIIAGKMRLELQSIDLGAIVRDAVEVVRPAAEARDIRLDIDSIESPAALVGDGVRLQQVTWNFLSNAVKFSRPRGLVTVSLRRDHSSMLLSVSDDGQGIGPEFIPHIFEPFRQADVGTTRRTGGVGLGLAIVKYIVEMHGGHVAVQSNGPGQGATFSARIPIRALGSPQEDAAAGLAPAAKTESDLLTANLTGVRVLVVDDEEDARDLLNVLFRTRGAKVYLAASAEQARAAVVSFEPDIIVCDIGMPHEDGYQFLQTVRARPANQGGATPAIALTAYAYEKDMKRALESGFNYHMAKPANHNVLLRVMNDLLHASGAQRRLKTN
ncbi:ATP-binding protein [Pendulispora rubella]|uniref:histidine kinase n=1 Tax=Pendulispora rubella TaxID=2741070 RepID=A0ABZ2L6Y7_9BACT